MTNCKDCVFKGVYQDMGLSCDVCNLQPDLLNAIKAVENAPLCLHRLTKGEAKEIVIERAGPIPTFLETKPGAAKEKPVTFEDAQENITKAFARLGEAISRGLADALRDAEEKEAGL